MAGVNFSLASIIPEPDTFTDLDGTQYQVLSTTDFSPKDYANVTRIMADMEAAQKLLANVQGNDVDEPLRLLTDSLELFLATICPDMPTERRVEMKFTHKQALMEWWNSIQPKPVALPNGRASVGTRSTPKRRSRS